MGAKNVTKNNALFVTTVSNHNKENALVNDGNIFIYFVISLINIILAPDTYILFSTFFLNILIFLNSFTIESPFVGLNIICLLI